MAVRHGVVTDLNLRIGVSIGRHPLFAELRHLPRAWLRRRTVTRLQTTEVTFGQHPRLGWVEIAHQRSGQIIWRVVQLKETQGFFSRDPLEITRPPDYRPTVWRRLPEQGVELFLELSGRGAVCTHPTLFVHDIALGVELAEHWIEQPVRFQPEPKLKFVGWHVHKVDRVVVTRASVHGRCTLSRIDATEVFLDNQFLLLSQQHIKFFEQLPVSDGSPRGIVRIVDLSKAMRLKQVSFFSSDVSFHLIELRNELEVLFDITRANGGRAFEHHVFKQVRHTGNAGPLIDRPNLGHPSCGHIRVPWPRQEQYGHAIVEHHFFDGHLLRRHGRSEQ